MAITMTMLGIIFLTCAALSWLAIRRCPLARAIGFQISQVSGSAR